ncbi:hypothetical protein IZ6_24560 [Terrihabitans soli]|uniref:Uncharacterized protein n=1 Tax=Terrihabitans soli TaxID=708113 RepID=A0A6S6QXH4_9HYPH|nr:hypothetical protein [Terrihabitans soli]BCJ91721.1 hypothetical protein IZ6_24560 [Terrihabitans soli]
MTDLDHIEALVLERVKSAQRQNERGSDRARMKQRVRENEASEILGLIRKLKKEIAADAGADQVHTG